MTISRSDLVPAIALVPFGYVLATRLKSIRDISFLVVTSWIPALWLLIRLGEADPAEALAAFLLGYLAFIAIYEIGYLINDVWDARRASAGRSRFGYQPGRAYLLLFVAVRLACWAGIGALTSWISDLVWLAGFAALVIALLQHNLIRLPALRLASFLELAVLRFSLPVVAAVPHRQLWIVILAALLLYAYPRFLSYMDSKSLLRLDNGRGRSFALLQLLGLAPLVLFIAFATSTPLLAELLAYFVIAYALGAMGFRPARQS